MAYLPLPLFSIFPQQLPVLPLPFRPYFNYLSGYECAYIEACALPAGHGCCTVATSDTVAEHRSVQGSSSTFPFRVVMYYTKIYFRDGNI